MVKRIWIIFLFMNMSVCAGLISAEDPKDSTSENISLRSEAGPSENANQTPSNAPRQHEAAVLAIEPRIVGTWLIDQRMGGGECKIRRSEIRTFDFELFDFSSHPDMSRKLFRFMDWNDANQQFRASIRRDDSFNGAVLYSLSLNSEGTELTCEMSFDDEGKKSLGLLKSQMTSEEYGSLFQKMTWVRKGTNPPNAGESRELRTNPVESEDRKANPKQRTKIELDGDDIVAREPMAKGVVSSVPKNSIMGQYLLLIETQDGLSAFSTMAGTWSRISVGPRKDGQPRLKTALVGNHFAVIVLDNKVLGFSVQAGRWGFFIVPDDVGAPIVPTVSEKMAFVQVGNRTYALSPTTGEWTSSDGGIVVPTDSKVVQDRLAVIDALNESVQRKEDPQEITRLKKALAEVETGAKTLARQLRSLSSQGESKELPATSDLQQKFESELNRAFDLKSQLEQIQIHELQSRLRLLEQRVGRRTLNRKQIVNRRKSELLEGQETEWNAEMSKDSAAIHGRSEIDGSSVNGLSAVAIESVNKVEDTSRETLNALVTNNAPKQLTTPTLRDSDVRMFKALAASRDPLETGAPAELASKILSARTDLIQADTQLTLSTEAETSKGELALAEAHKESARNRVAIAEDTFRSKMKEAAIRVEGATANVKREKERLQAARNLFSNARAQYKDVQEAEALVQSAELVLQTGKAQLDLYNKIEEQLFERGIITSMKSWTRMGLPDWGMMLMPVSSSQDEMRAKFKGFKYRGGLLVVDVRENSAAATSGIVPGAILVMLGPSEVSSFQDVKRLLVPRKGDEEPFLQVKFKAIQDQILIGGSLPLPSNLSIDHANGQAPSIKEAE